MKRGSTAWLASRSAFLLSLSSGCRAEARGEEAALANADAALTTFVGTLRATLGDAIAKGGPRGAVELCAAQAPSLRARTAEAAHVKLGRASVRLRSAADAAPDWVSGWLAAQGERKADGVVGVRTVVATPQGRVARVLRPIAIEAPCLACHGDDAHVSPEVRAAIRARYPADAAMGYAVGDLRGAAWAEAPVEPTGLARFF